jgi:hypothetical protein
MIKDGVLAHTLAGAAIAATAAVVLTAPANAATPDNATAAVLLKKVQGIDMTADSIGRITLARSTADPGAVAADLQTVAIRQGDSLVDVTARGSTQSADSVTISRGAVTETIAATADGAEQSWGFRQTPGTSGDLTVSIQTTGLTYANTTADGLHLQQTGVLDLAYSNGTWIDARDHRWPVPARFDHGLILLTVPAQALAGTTYPAVLDPQIEVNPIST